MRTRKSSRKQSRKIQNIYVIFSEVGILYLWAGINKDFKKSWKNKIMLFFGLNFGGAVAPPLAITHNALSGYFEFSHSIFSRLQDKISNFFCRSLPYIYTYPGIMIPYWIFMHQLHIHSIHKCILLCRLSHLWRHWLRVIRCEEKSICSIFGTIMSSSFRSDSWLAKSYRCHPTFEI